MRTIAAFALAMLLTACANLAGPETPAQRVFAIQADFNAVLVAAVTYESQPRCAGAVSLSCSDPAIVEQMRRAANHAATSIRAAQEVVRDPAARESTAAALIIAAESAVKAVAQILEHEGVL